MRAIGGVVQIRGDTAVRQLAPDLADGGFGLRVKEQVGGVDLVPQPGVLGGQVQVDFGFRSGRLGDPRDQAVIVLLKGTQAARVVINDARRKNVIGALLLKG